MTLGRHKKRKKTLTKVTEKQKTKQRNMTLKFLSITEMMMNMKKNKKDTEIEKQEMQNQKIIKKTIQIKEEEEIENNEEIITLEFQSKDNDKKLK